MTFNAQTTSIELPPSRRLFLSGLGKATLSATAVAIIAGCESMAKSDQMAANPAGDVEILNVALDLEHEAIAAYQMSADSGLLQKPVLDTALLFQGHHKQHRDALMATIGRLGGKPVGPAPMEEYARRINAPSLKSQTDVLVLAAKLERAATNAYLGVIPSFSDPALGQVAGRISADETMHWTVLSQALAQPLPREALTFGA
jgi:rubrerythrin